MQTAPLNFIVLNSSPLLKASRQTNFIYENIGQDLIVERWKFTDIEGDVFRNNLVLVDSYLPNILSEIVLYAFVNQQKSLTNVVDAIEKINPLNLRGLGGIKFYRHKIKQFLMHLAFGMNENEVYFGEPNLYDYYPVLKDGDKLIYYGENIEMFLNTMLDKAQLVVLSEVYSVGEKSYLRLNLQITL